MTSLNAERGVALLGALLIALILSALGMALTVSGQTEVSVVRNHQRTAEARAAAEAGLSHGVQLAVRRLNAAQANGFATVGAAITAVLRGPDNEIHATASNPENADNGSFETMELAGETELPRFPAILAIAAMVGSSYQGRIIDEDHPSRNLSAADRARIGENGQAEADGNNRAVIEVTGFALDSTAVALEAIIARQMPPAIVSDQTITVSGDPTINGFDGNIHSNVNIVNSGNPTIAGSYTATGTYTNSGSPDVTGQFGGGRPIIPIPEVSAADYRDEVNEAAAAVTNDGLVLTVGGATGGRIYDGFLDSSAGTVGGAPLCDASANNANCLAAYGWEYDPGNSGWKIPSLSLRTNSTFYVRGNVTISGNPGEGGPHKVVTIIAEGSIDVGGNPWLTPHTPGVMFVTNGDLKLNGNMRMLPTAEGAILVREQLDMSGNKLLYGYISVDNAANASNLVINTTISGNPTVTFNGTIGGQGFTVTGWRERR